MPTVRIATMVMVRSPADFTSAFHTALAIADRMTRP